MAAAAILDFQKIQNFNGSSAVRCQCTALYQISSKSVKRLQKYSDLTVFSKWRPSAILDLLGTYWDTHDDHLVVSIVLPNLIKIDALVSIMGCAVAPALC